MPEGTLDSSCHRQDAELRRLREQNRRMRKVLVSCGVIIGSLTTWTRARELRAEIDELTKGEAP